MSNQACATIVQRELRKMHLRWWHASEPRMRTILQAAGLDESRLKMIKSVVDTCRECRAWQRPGKNVTTSVNLYENFNHTTESDLFFWKDFIAWHQICKCIRFSAATEITNKRKETLLQAYRTSWVQQYGPCQFMIMDGECGLNNEEAKQDLKRLGTTLQVRASGQHLSLIHI